MSLQSVSTAISNGLFLTLVAGLPLYAYIRKVKVYEEFITGAKEGLTIVIRIIPYLLAMLVAIGMFRASGAMDSLVALLSPILQLIGMPADVLPLALMRPLSGNGANAMLADIIHTHGGNAFVSQLAATMAGSTETTFYVIAIYFGAARIRRTRHAIPAGLIADAVGIATALIICHWVFSASAG